MALGTLVRIPAFKELRCAHTPDKPCTLVGNNLFLAESISAAEDFSNATEIPLDFTGGQLAVPHPVNGGDDPQTVQTLTLPVTVVTAQASQPRGQTAAVQTQPPGTPPVDAATPAKPEQQ